MSTMIWKEWRENLKWAVLALIALGAAEFHGLPSQGIEGGWPRSEGALTGGGFDSMNLLGCIVVGFLLGLIQFRPEVARDRWAALLHRPGGRGSVFGGKIVAGVALYFAIVVPPFILCAGYTAFPGHYAVPFLPEMLLPGLTHIVRGCLFYFLGVLVGLDRGRWMGLRLAGGWLIVFVSQETAMDFGVEMAAYLVVAILLMLAAWGSLVSPVAFSRRPWTARAAALVIAVIAVSGLGVDLPALWFRPATQSGGEREYVVGEDGVPLLVEDWGGLPNKVFNLRGSRIDDPRYAVDQIHRHSWKFFGFGSGRIWSQENGRGRVAMVSVGEGGYAGKEQWYYLPRKGYFVGYSQATRLRVAIYDREGFRAPDAVPVPFAQEAAILTERWSPMIIRIGNDVLAFRFEAREAQTLRAAKEGAISGVATYFLDQRLGLAAAQADGISIFDESGVHRAFLPYSRDLQAWRADSIVINPAADHFFVQYLPREKGDGYPRWFDEFDSAGRLLHAYPAAVVPDQPAALRPVLPMAAFAWKALQSPLQAEGERLLRSRTSYNWTTSRFWAFWMERQGWKAWPWEAAVSLVCAAAAAVVAVWAGFSRRANIGWAALSLAFGPGGLLVFLWLADWPVRGKCPACGKSRRVDGEACPHCSAAWPAPERDGTEIFDAVRPEEAWSGRG